MVSVKMANSCHFHFCTCYNKTKKCQHIKICFFFSLVFILLSLISIILLKKELEKYD